MTDKQPQPFGSMHPIADIDDLVTVRGCDGAVFQVEGFTHEIEYDRGETNEAILYDVTDLRTMDFLIAFQDDITVVTDTQLGRESLANKGAETFEQTLERINADEIARKHRAFEGSVYDEVASVIEQGMAHLKAESTDGLLDELSDALSMQANFGDHEDDEKRDRKYAIRVCEIKEKLRDLTEGVGE